MLLGQSAQTTAPVPKVASPDILSDGRVTFRFYDPGAKEVSLHLEGVPENAPMRRDAQGVWSITTAPLPPDYYGYSFIADGVRRLDPNNTSIKPNLVEIESLLHLTGSTPQPWDVTGVPHGVVHHHLFQSAVVGNQNDFYVYTPPGYDANAKTKYPALYLLHGFSDDASGWTAVGKANLILDNLIASGKARPMIVVMPLGYGAPQVLSGGWQDRQMDRYWLENLQKFAQMLLTEVIPQVEQQYRVSTDREDRAVAGLSMGGAESLFVGLNQTEKFAWVGGFSSGLRRLDFPAQFAGATAKSASQLRLLWIACGTDDSLLDSNRKFEAWLRAQGIQPKVLETPGAHTWMVWRRNLIAFASQLFQKP